MKDYPELADIDPTELKLDRVHLVGIGGAGMSGIAHILLDRGATVSGSDMKDSRSLLALRAAGAKIVTQHEAENLSLSGQLPTCVVTSFAAIPATNPELVAAREQGIPVVRRSDVLAALMQGYKSIAIAGTHGKTSTTSMSVVALQAAGEDPSFAIGGQLTAAGTNAHHSTRSIFVAEADESDASLLTYRPRVGVVTTVEPDHLDYFGSHEAYYQVFDDFVATLQPGGYLIVCLDDDGAAALGERVSRDDITVLGYGSPAAAEKHPTILCAGKVTDITPHSTLTDATVEFALPTEDGAGTENAKAHHLKVYLPGTHMVYNAVAAVLAGAVSGVAIADLVQGINNFRGVRRRFDFHGRVHGGPFDGARVYDDYAHHPTEVRAVLTAARERVDAEGKGNRVLVVFQPHLYSRTQEFAAEFATALSLADQVLVLGIYGAREAPVAGVDSSVIADHITSRVGIVERIDEVPAAVAEVAQAGDLIVTMGAGSVTMVADPILDALSDFPDAEVKGETRES